MDQAHGSAEKKEEVQRDESSKVAGSRGDRITSTSSSDAFAEAIAKRAEAQANLGKTLGRRMMLAVREPVDREVLLPRS